MYNENVCHTACILRNASITVITEQSTVKWNLMSVDKKRSRDENYFSYILKTQNMAFHRQRLACTRELVLHLEEAPQIAFIIS